MKIQQEMYKLDTGKQTTVLLWTFTHCWYVFTHLFIAPNLQHLTDGLTGTVDVHVDGFIVAF